MPGRTHRCRDGFTLIELLVTITLIMIIAGLGVAFLPTIGDTARQAQAASMLQQWISIAKHKALRDQVPCGIRLNPLVDPVTKKVNAAQSRQCQFIEQPDDFAFPPTSSVGALSATAGQTSVTINSPLGDQIAPGDYLEILGVGLVYRITALRADATKTQVQLGQRRPMPYDINGTKLYRVIRAPRVAGDDLLALPDPVTIDLSTNARYGSSLPTANVDGSYDILFSPTGAVISPGLTTESINLWVRNASAAVASTSDGEQTILAIYVRSGLVAAHPPAPGADPYAFIKDGRTSGK
jgi:prepilin-type N-terminal cleavage/methylation domain-containing protein